MPPASIHPAQYGDIAVDARSSKARRGGSSQLSPSQWIAQTSFQSIKSPASRSPSRSRSRSRTPSSRNNRANSEPNPFSQCNPRTPLEKLHAELHDANTALLQAPRRVRRDSQSSPVKRVADLERRIDALSSTHAMPGPAPEATPHHQHNLAAAHSRGCL